jgi:hypothetical protein
MPVISNYVGRKMQCDLRGIWDSRKDGRSDDDR